MLRRSFLSAAAAGVVGLRGSETDVMVERAQTGAPHAGKVLAAIQPHSDDIPIFAAGTVIKLIDEGYTGYLIRVTNDDMAGPGTIGNTVLENEKDNLAVARALGCKKVFDLNYSNHQMDQESRLEIRARFIFLFRLLKVDTIVCYDPWGHYEENPDHYVTAQAAEAACWMAGGDKDYPEHFAAGLKPHAVGSKYYFARGPQLVNRVVDISGVIDRKVAVNRVNLAQGPGGNNGIAVRKRLAERGMRIPELGDNDETAANVYIKQAVLTRDSETGKKYGVAYAEPFHYIGPTPDPAEEYIKKNAVKAR